MLTCLSLTLLLNACTPPEPTVFGVPQSQWNQLTPAQKQQVIDGYNQRQRIKEENAPLQSAIDSASALVQQQQQSNFMNKQMKMPPMPPLQ